MRGRFLIALALVGVARQLPAQAVNAAPVTVEVRPSKTEVTVGEVFTVELHAVGPAGTAYTFPADASTDSVELRSVAAGGPAGETQGGAGGSTLGSQGAEGVHRYAASVFALGEGTLPAISVRYRLADGTAGEASSVPLVVKVQSLLAKDPAEQKLADVRGPVGASVGRAFWVALALAALAIGGLGYALWRRRAKPSRVAAVARAELSPADEARAALEALAGRDLPGRGEYRAFYIELAAVAKRYLERRLAAPVLEMTSAETLAFLRAHAHGGELLPIVRELAEAADRVKFARGDGLADEAQRHLASVRRLVGALEERLRPVVVEDGKREGRAA